MNKKTIIYIVIIVILAFCIGGLVGYNVRGYIKKDDISQKDFKNFEGFNRDDFDPNFKPDKMPNEENSDSTSEDSDNKSPFVFPNSNSDEQNNSQQPTDDMTPPNDMTPPDMQNGNQSSENNKNMRGQKGAKSNKSQTESQDAQNQKTSDTTGAEV